MTRPFPRLLLACVSVCFAVVLPNAYGQKRPSDAAITKAVERGVAFLRTKPWDYSNDGKASGNWQYDAGATALIGLALLESDVPKSDPALVNAARAIRSVAPRLTKTYAISLAIMFLDRYGGSNESDLIRDLAYRLVAGQDATSWGWSYDCPIIKDHRAMLSFLNQYKNWKDFGKYEPTGTACNSNSQFAVLALWIARRHNVPAEFPLARAEMRFRNTQHEDGGWGYRHDTAGSSPAMTCSGLLGLAVGFGNRRAQLRSGDRLDDPMAEKKGPLQKEDIRLDPAVIKARDFIAKQVTRAPESFGHWPYFLWSLERVCVVYGYEEFGKVDWYAWGASALVGRQQQDGSWDGGYPPQINTAFALLFLRKANLSRDLAMLVADEGPGNKPPAAGPERFINELPRAKPERRTEILQLLEETKDTTGSYTQALIDGIPRLQGELKEQARRALAGRLSRQSVKSLRDRLQESDPEVRLAVARAAGIKQAMELVPDLINLLDAGDAAVANAALESLKAITKKDHGKNAQAWRDYWLNAKK